MMRPWQNFYFLVDFQNFFKEKSKDTKGSHNDLAITQCNFIVFTAYFIFFFLTSYGVIVNFVPFNLIAVIFILCYINLCTCSDIDLGKIHQPTDHNPIQKNTTFFCITLELLYNMDNL